MQALQIFHVVNVPAWDYLHIREGPGSNYQITSYLPPATDGISITGAGVQNGATLWVPIVFGQVRGWVSKEYLASTVSKVEFSTNQGQQSPSSFAGERYPQTRLRALTTDDLKEMSVAELRYAINEVYARYGAAFSNNPDIRRQFQKFSWYHPNPNITFSDIDQSMSEVEKQNVKLLGQYRDARRSK
jgi:YARHG domain/Bacterial SH3 domain